MAWFVSVEYKDSELGTYWAPTKTVIESEEQRFKALGLTLAEEIEAEYMAGPRDRNSVDYPWFGAVYDYPPLLKGWRWPMQDKPFREQLEKYEEDIIDIIPAFGSWAISQQVIDIIEAIEPGVHQYLPYELLNPDGSVHPAKRWLLNVCTRAECVDVEKSNVAWAPAPFDYKFMDHSNDKRLAVKADEARKRAVWFEWRYGGYDAPLISDAFWNAVKSAGLRGWQPDHYFPDYIEEA
jgi:hypothetical protein